MNGSKQMSIKPILTVTQQKFFALLSDGQRHYDAEFIELLPDPLGTSTNVLMHIHNIRKVIRPLGEDIVRERICRKGTYRRVRLIGPGE